MGFINWLFSDNTPNTSEISNKKNGNTSDDNDLNVTDCNKIDMINYNDKDFILMYNTNAILQLESNIKKHMYKICDNGEEFFICHMTHSDPYLHKEYYSDYNLLKHKEMKIHIAFNVIDKDEKDRRRYGSNGLFTVGGNYVITVDFSELINVETLINKMSDEFFKKNHAKNKAKKDVERLFNKVGKCHED